MKINVYAEELRPAGVLVQDRESAADGRFVGLTLGTAGGAVTLWDRPGLKGLWKLLANAGKALVRFEQAEARRVATLNRGAAKPKRRAAKAKPAPLDPPGRPVRRSPKGEAG